MTTLAPEGIPQDIWDELPPEARLKHYKSAERNEALSKFLSKFVFLPPLLFVTVPFVNAIASGLLPDPTAIIKMIGGDRLSNLDLSEPTDGETITGTTFTVTSPFGMRIHPIDGTQKMHRGVDVGTPTGTPLYAPAVAGDEVTVKCIASAFTRGGGLVADIQSESIPDFTFKALHLDTCQGGTYGPGEQFATTGNTGNSTGPHLDWQTLPANSQQRVPPKMGHLSWVLSGSIPGKAPDTLLEKIKQEESFSPTAYWDVSAYSIGYGTQTYPDGSAVQLGDTITEPEALKLAKFHVDKVAGEVEAMVSVPLSENEKAALIDLTYNAGSGAIASSTLIKKLNQGDRVGAADEFLKWDKANGETLPGLTERRKRNRELFLSKD